MEMNQRRGASREPRRAQVQAVSKDGYKFDPQEPSWKLNKDVTVAIGIAANLPEPTQVGFRATLQRYAEEMSAMHTYNMCEKFKRYLRDTGTDAITSASLLNWRATLGVSDQSMLGGLKGFLLTWHDYGFAGVSDEVVDLLEGWRLKGNEKGVAVISGCPETGPYTDLEIAAILGWANMAVARSLIPFRDYAYLLTLVMTARRAVQIAALRGKDLVNAPGDSQCRVNFPRAKQRGGAFRQEFRSLAVVEDLYLVLRHQHQLAVRMVETRLGTGLAVDLAQEVPVFISERSLTEVSDQASLRRLLVGPRPDALHERINLLASGLRELARLSTARSERTGEFVRLTATRFRRTRGTKLRREGFGPFVIAELLDHSDIQNVDVYIQSTAQDAVVIDQLVGPKLAPFAQACMGKLVWSEREAIRGNDPRSRVPNNLQHGVGTCGNYGFCASGYRACYTCYHFQPWVHGPHEEVLTELYTEKARARSAGCAEQVVNATDPLILAVEHCVQLCQTAKLEAVKVPHVEEPRP
ncbi:site-specific integrase [Cupriavidus oxalaticus]|uniref:site-specific integrase n=1 Tax=Cupriavidus oxalaticus TaxID=96344 RepID=UPI0040344B95